MDKLRNRFMLLVGDDYSCTFQDQPMCYGQFLSKSPIWLQFTWNFFNVAWSSLSNYMFQKCKYIILLHSYSYLVQAFTPGTQMTFYLV